MIGTVLSRRLRRTGGRLVRRWGLLPAGDPDGLGDDDALRGQSLPFTVLVYFPDTVPNLYQLRQWYGPLRQLDRRHRVGVVCLDSRTAKAVRAECDLPVVCCGRVATLEDLVSRSDVALALYVNHNVRNLHPLRFPTMLHAYLGHGESDKVASASNQVKAYDFVLVAGDAGRDRLRRNLLRFDVDTHVRLVGRPQLDLDDAPAPVSVMPDTAASEVTVADATGPAPGGSRPTVLYAPTWEGAQPSMAYSSVLSHGEALLRSLLSGQTYRVVYRPHPRAGANSVAYAAADQRLRALVRERHSTDPDAGHAVDLAPTWDVRRDPADLLISDISAVAGEWMTTGKPLVVTIPAAPEAFLDADTVFGAVPGLPAADAGQAADLVARELADREGAGRKLADRERAGEAAQRRQEWVRHTMGDISPRASMARFLAVCGELVELRGQEMAARAARRAGDRP